jgi:hypothetical protein
MAPVFEGREGILMLRVVGATGPNVPVVTCSSAAAGRGGLPYPWRWGFPSMICARSRGTALAALTGAGPLASGSVQIDQ